MIVAQVAQTAKFRPIAQSGHTGLPDMAGNLLAITVSCYLLPVWNLLADLKGPKW